MPSNGAILTNNPNLDAYGVAPASSDDPMGGSTSSSPTVTPNPYPAYGPFAANKPALDLFGWVDAHAPKWDANRTYGPGDQVNLGGIVYRVPDDMGSFKGVRPGLDGAKWASCGTVQQNYDYYANQSPRPAGYGEVNPSSSKESPDVHEPTYLQGPPGRDGLNGKDGNDGAKGKDGLNGKDGLDGKDGKDGVNGKDGIDGSLSPKGKLEAAALGFFGGLVAQKVGQGVQDLKGFLAGKVHDFVHNFLPFLPGATQADEAAVDHDLDTTIDNSEVVWGKPGTYETSVTNGSSSTFKPVLPSPPQPSGVLQTGPENTGWRFFAGGGQWGYAPPGQPGDAH